MNATTAVLVALIVWWAGTGVLFLLNRLRPSATPFTVLGSCAAVGAAVAAIEVSAPFATPAGAYVAFSAAVLLWAGLEMPHLLGVFTGPVRDACPPALRGFPRFTRAIGVGLYHDLAIMATGLGLIALLLRADNAVAAWTFCTLWLMRWSAKLNLFLGMPNVDLDLVPERMRYLATYMTARAMNPLFPVSVILGALVFAYHLTSARPGDVTGAFEVTAGTLLATLTGLAVIEHLLMVIPLKESALWRWALPEAAAKPVKT
ncbi:MAG: putative photosynthetic complex assembly protein PuhE [Pseudomonadota bacterium]